MVEDAGPDNLSRSPTLEETYMDLMENVEYLWKILDFEMDAVTGWDIGLPLLEKSQGRVKRYLITRRVDCVRD